jgi:pyruvate dehydrogenase E2 component (dihydrolipoamide acetyltransferase)
MARLPRKRLLKRKRPKEEKQTAEAASDTGSDESGKRLKASPLARSMAKESGIDLSKLSGSGDGGRIVKKT